MLTGAEILQLDDLALAARVEQVNLFCRVGPAQKNRVILALKRRGHVVGYLGDGINDAPSLHSADVGISVDSSLTVVVVAVVLPFTPAGVHLGFVAPPAFLFLILIVMLLAYLLAVEAMKNWFFSRLAAE